jgi:kynureninase
MTIPFEPSEQRVREMDQRDRLARFRDEFYTPAGHIYLDGNSLGLLCRRAEATLSETVSQWKELGIGGWLDASPAWFDLAELLGAQLAPLVGAAPNEVIVTNSTTVNLHQLLATFYDPVATSDVVLADSFCFPSDRYCLESFLRLLGKSPAQTLRYVGQTEQWTLCEDTIINAMTPDVQIVVLPAVVYTSGQLLDVERLTRAAHDRGKLIGFDCSHSVGAVAHQFAQLDIDFAFFCTYKYLNGGPGAPGAIYLNRRHFGRRAGLAGWFGSDKDRQFEMSGTFHQASHAGGLQIGTPQILSAAPLRGALQLIREAGMEAIRTKSLALTKLLRTLIEARLSPFGFRCVSPAEPHRRGGHVAVSHQQGALIAAELRARGVVPDFRPPDLIRLAPAALYTSFLDCYRAIEILRDIVEQQSYKSQSTRASRVP